MNRTELRQQLFDVIRRADINETTAVDGISPTVQAEIRRIVEQLFADGLDDEPTDPRQIAGIAAVRERAADGAIVLAENDSGMHLR